ncbi:hypothetical protein [Spirosoma sp. 48-14]|nr:hypothetical protein [Spirosoma sp. 48-14]
MKKYYLSLLLSLLFLVVLAQRHKESKNIAIKTLPKMHISKNSNQIKIHNGKDTVLYIKQLKGEYLKFKAIDEGIGSATNIAFFAVFISILAIYFPIRFNVKSERRSTFFKIYEYWNTEYMLNSRQRFWQVLREERADIRRIELKRLYETKQQDYYTYEAVYDLLNAIARLYFQNKIDKKLVRALMITFIRSYGYILEKCFVFHDSKNSFFIKMSKGYYRPVTMLREEICKGEDKTYALFEEIEGMEKDE